MGSQQGNRTIRIAGSVTGQALIFALSTTVIAAGTQAEEPETTPAGRVGYPLEEIVVTARRRAEDIMATPISITAFTADSLTARQIDQAHQIAEATPNLVFRKQVESTSIASIIYIRGIGQRDFSPTVQPGVSTYMDGAYMANVTGGLVDVVDIESIQVLRGPQGTLFGRNTIGGAVLINSIKPHQEFGADLELIAGDYSRKQIKASVNVPFTDSFFGKFSGMAREKDGYVKTPNIPGDNEAGRDDTWVARAALRWVPTQSLTIDLVGDMSHHESDGPPIVLGDYIDETTPGTASGDYNNDVAPVLGWPLFTNEAYTQSRLRYVAESTLYEKAEADIWSATLTVDWEFADVNLKSITNYRDLDTEDGQDGDYSPASVYKVNQTFEGNQWSQELQLSARPGTIALIG